MLPTAYMEGQDMAATRVAIPEKLHFWIDFGLDQASLDVFQNTDTLVGYVSRYESGAELNTFITYVEDKRLFSKRAALLVAVIDPRTNVVQMTDELQVSERDAGMPFSMNVRAKCVAMTRAVADVLGLGAGIPFKRDRPVQRTAAR